MVFKPILGILFMIGSLFFGGYSGQSGVTVISVADITEEDTTQYSADYSTETHVEGALTYEEAFLMGQKLKALDDDETLDEVVITVEGRPIARRVIEESQILLDFGVGTSTLKESINTTIRNFVLEAEAARLGVDGSQDEVDESIRFTKTVYKDFYENGLPDFLQGYIDGRGITEEEYYSTSAHIAYRSTIRNNLWLKYRAEHETEIQNEAKSRNILVEDAAKEYRQKYEAELIEKADIKFLDPEIEKLLE